MNTANKSADKHLRTAFEGMLQKQNTSPDPLPPRLFRIDERKGEYTWPGLEPRFKDFCEGARWFSEELTATSSVMQKLTGKGLV